MEVIAIGQMREFLLQTLPKFDDPIFVISATFYPGCPKCESEATVYKAFIAEKHDFFTNSHFIQVEQHRFPCNVYFEVFPDRPLPIRAIIGTRPIIGGFEPVVRKIE